MKKIILSIFLIPAFLIVSASGICAEEIYDDEDAICSYKFLILTDDPGQAVSFPDKNPDLSFNSINDASLLTGSDDLEDLWLDTNKTSYLELLGGLRNLESSSLYNNRESHIGPLSVLTGLTYFNLFYKQN